MTLLRQQDCGGPIMYSAFGLLKPDSDFTMTEAASRLSARFPSFSVEQEADTIEVSCPGWEIHLILNERHTRSGNGPFQRLSARGRGAPVLQGTDRRRSERTIPFIAFPPNPSAAFQRDQLVGCIQVRSINVVSTRPSMNAALSMILRWIGIVVLMPSTTNSARARRMTAIASARVG